MYIKWQNAITLAKRTPSKFFLDQNKTFCQRKFTFFCCIVLSAVIWTINRRQDYSFSVDLQSILGLTYGCRRGEGSGSFHGPKILALQFESLCSILHTSISLSFFFCSSKIFFPQRREFLYIADTQFPSAEINILPQLRERTDFSHFILEQTLQYQKNEEPKKQQN